MGIRVHKQLGYGFDDLAYDKEKWRHTDPRINPDSPLLQYDYESGDLLRYKRWIAKQNESRDWSEKNRLDSWFLMDEFKKPKRKRKAHSVSEAVAFQPEFGLSNVICIRPISCPDWERRDDSIDYIEESYRRIDQDRDHVRILQGPLYPFSTWMDARTGKRCGNITMWITLHMSNIPQDGDEMDEMARIGGFEGHAEAALYCVPFVPQEIRDICTYGNLFTDPTTVYQLKPMIYTWWG